MATEGGEDEGHGRGHQPDDFEVQPNCANHEQPEVPSLSEKGIR